MVVPTPPSQPPPLQPPSRPVYPMREIGYERVDMTERHDDDVIVPWNPKPTKPDYGVGHTDEQELHDTRNDENIHGAIGGWFGLIGRIV